LSQAIIGNPKFVTERTNEFAVNYTLDELEDRMRFAKPLSTIAGVVAVAISAAAIPPAFAHDGWKHHHKRHKHHHDYHYIQRDYGRYYSAPRVIYERPVYREAPMYYGPSGPPSLNLYIPLR